MRQPGWHLLVQLRSTDHIEDGEVAFSVYENLFTWIVTVDHTLFDDNCIDLIYSSTFQGLDVD